MTNRKQKLLPPLTFFALALVLCVLAIQPLAASPRASQAAAAQAKSDAVEVRHVIYGTVRSVEGSKFTIETRAKKTIQIDTKAAIDGQRSVVLIVGHAVLVHGTYDAKGVLHASSVQKAKSSSALWPEDK